MSRGPRTREQNQARLVRCTAGCRRMVWLQGALPVAADTEYVCAPCTARAAARAADGHPAWGCLACAWTGPDRTEAVDHERLDHEGAAVCMPIDSELDAFRAARGAGATPEQAQAAADLATGRDAAALRDGIERPF